MYKVFVNDSPIIITSSSKTSNNFLTYPYKDVVLDDLIEKLRNKKYKGINLITNDLENDWKSFLANTEVIPAAGGLVLNAKNDVLVIFRNGVWDLAKGWLDPWETIENAALREVEEECGIFNLKLIKPLVTAYHIYFHKGVKLKQTYWFLMSSDYQKALTPQTEEGITQVAFKNEEEIKEIFKNTYENIKIVYDTFKEQSFY
jgi:ADP-ribose pyrophosphatase YjhB (NUDIX family)